MACRTRLQGASLLLVLTAWLYAVGLPARGTTVNGTLTLAPELSQLAEKLTEKRLGSLPSFWRVPNGVLATLDAAVQPESDLAVLLESKSAPGVAPAGTTALVKLRGAGLHPAVTVVTPHTKVRFRNEDVFIYQLTSEENTQMANAPQLPPGNQVDFSFDEPGVYSITDRRLPHVQGWVVVVNSGRALNPESAKQAKQPADAAFSFPDVEPGEYLIKVFYGGAWLIEHPLVVPEKQREVGVQIRLPPDGPQHQQESTSGASGAPPQGEH